MSEYLPVNDPMYTHDVVITESSSTDQSMEIIEMEAMEETILECEMNSPETTKKAYNPKIKEFQVWCNDAYRHISIEERFTVTGPKLHLFLKTMVINRASRRRGQEDKVIQMTTIYQYVAAITHYYQTQVHQKKNGHPHPKSACTGILKMCRLREENAGRVSCKDRGLNTSVDGYTTIDEIASLSYYYIGQNTFHDLRNCTAFILSHFCLLRGESVRGAELPDLQVVNLEEEGPTRFCPALILVMRNGKTNTSGRLDVSGCIRNRDIRICPFMVTAMYFFAMYHVDCKPFPDFTISENWYFTKFLQASADSTKQWSYSAHHKAMEKALKACNIASSKITHMARGASARMCDLGGVDQLMIKRLGRWNADNMSRSYVTGLPLPGMRFLGGYGTEKGKFYLRRSALEPPMELQSKIFPEADKWMDKLNSGVITDNAAARGFLQLLKTMRITFLQDASLMIDDFPHHRVFKHCLFQDPLFLQFKSDLGRVMSEENTPKDILLQQTMPLMPKVVQDAFKEKEDAIKTLQIQNAQLLQQLADLTPSKAPVRVTVEVPPTAVASSDLPTQMDVDPVSSGEVEQCSGTYQNQQATLETNLTSHAWSRSTVTIPDLWREYSVGLGGGYSIESLNASHPNWFLPHDKNFHYRRMRIIHGLKKYAIREGITIETCVPIAEKKRTLLKKSLHSLGKATDSINELLI